MSNSLIQILREHHIWKMNYSTNKVQVSDMMIWESVHTVVTVFLPQHSLVTSLLLSCHNHISLTTRNLRLWNLVTDQMPWHFRVSRNSKKVVTLNYTTGQWQTHQHLVYHCLHATAARCLSELCTLVAKVASRKHLPSLCQNERTVPCHKLSSADRHAFSVTATSDSLEFFGRLHG